MYVIKIYPYAYKIIKGRGNMNYKNDIEYVDVDIELISDDEVFARFYYNGEPTDYAISTRGRVYNMRTGKLRKLRSRPDGRHDVNLSFGSKDNCRTFMYIEW